MERKQFSFSFSIPSFLKRVKTENASGENIPGSSSVETQKNDQLPSGSGCQPANPFRSPSIRAPPSSPRIPPKTMDIFATPRRPVPSNTQETLPQSNTPRPSTYAGRGGLVTRSSRDSPVPTIFSLKRRGIQPIASSVEDVQVEESSLSKRAIGLPPGNVRKEMASPRNVFPLRLNLGPRSSPLKQKTSPSLAPISPTEVQPLRTEPADLNAAFSLDGRAFTSTFDLIETNDSAKSTADESVNNAFIADNTDEDKRKSTTDTELKELRVKMSNDEKYKSDLISENSTLKSELEATLKRTLQFEAECKALNERLAEGEDATKLLTIKKDNLAEELAYCKQEKSDVENEVKKLKVDVDGLEHQLCERKATAEIQEAEKEILTKQLKDAQEKISICEIQVNSYETENSLLGSQLAELTSDNSKAEEKIEELLATISHLKEERATLEAEVANVRKDFREAIEDYQRTIEDEKKSHELTKNVLEEAKMAASVFKADLEISNESVSQAKVKVDELFTTITDLKAGRATLEDELSNVRKDFREAVEKYQREIEEEKSSLESTKTALEEAKMTVSVLKADLELSNESLSQAKVKVDELITTNSHLKQERATLEDELSNVREDFQGTVERYQREIEEEKLSHGSTKAALEEAKMRASVLKTDLEKSNKTLSQLHSNTASLADEKFTLETRIHTLKNELLICENSLDNALDRASSLETAQNNLTMLLAESKVKLELTQVELDQSKAEVCKLQRDNEALIIKVENGKELKDIAIIASDIFKDEDQKNDVAVGQVELAGTADENTRLEETHFVNCGSPDMFESDTCSTCDSVKITLQTLESSINGDTLNVKKCSVFKEVLKGMAQASTSSWSHNALNKVLEDFNSSSLGKNDDCKTLDIHQIDVSAELDEPSKKQLEELFSLVNEVVKKSVDEYAQAISMLNDLFNELRALTKKHENTRPLVESTEQEIIAYKHLVRELLNSSSLSLQEANKKLIALENENSTLKNAENELNQRLDSLRQEVHSTKANVLALKHRNEESEKIIEIYNEKIIELEMNLRLAAENESKLEATKTTLESELQAARSQFHLLDGDRVQLAKALLEVKEYKRQLDNERAANKTATASIAEYREKIDAIESKLGVKEMEVKEKEALLDEQENQIKSLRHSISLAEQNYKEKVKSMDAIFKTKETELSSMGHRHNITITELYKTRERESKLDAEVKQLRREVETLKTNDFATDAETRYHARLNTWSSFLTDAQAHKGDETSHPPVAKEGFTIKEERGSTKAKTQNTVDTEALAESNKPQCITPSKVAKKRLRCLSPGFKIKQEPSEVVSPKKTKKAVYSSVVHQGKGGKQKGVVDAANDDDEFQSTSTVGPVRRTYTRAGARATSTPKIDRTSKPVAASSKPPTPAGSSRKRSKTAQ